MQCCEPLGGPARHCAGRPAGLRRGPGGAVAADLVPWRQPAAASGGFHPPALRPLPRTCRDQADYGRCPLGIVAFASSLDQAGPMTKTVPRAAIMFGRYGRVLTPKTAPLPSWPCPIFEAALRVTSGNKTVPARIPQLMASPGEIDKTGGKDGIWPCCAMAGARDRPIFPCRTRNNALPAYYVMRGRRKTSVEPRRA